MAMTLRLTDDETAALRAQAAREGRSMQEIARAAVSEYISRRGTKQLVEDELKYVVSEYAEALDRLGKI